MTALRAPLLDPSPGSNDGAMKPFDDETLSRSNNIVGAIIRFVAIVALWGLPALLLFRCA